MIDAVSRRLGRGLFCCLVVSCLMAQDGPDARLGNVMWRTPDRAVWTTAVSDGWVVFRAAVPDGEFVTLRIAPGFESLGEFRGQFERWVDHDLTGATGITKNPITEKMAQSGFQLLQQSVTCDGEAGRIMGRLYLGMEPAGRFEMVVLSASTTGLLRDWAPRAVELINTIRFVNVAGELVPEGGATAPADDQADFRRRDINQDGWLDGTETAGLEPYDTNADREITWAEFQAGRAKERGGVLPAAPAAQPVPAAPAAPAPVLQPNLQPAAPQPDGPAPKAPGPQALPAGRQGLDGLYFWLETAMFGGNLSITHYHLALRPNGQALLGCPPGGLEQFDFDRLAQLDPAHTGYYSLAGGRLHFESLLGAGRSWEFKPLDDANIELNGLFAMKVGRFPAGYQFDGWYEAVQGASGVGGRVTSIRSYRFRADGTVAVGRYGAVSNKETAADASGLEQATYEIAGNTITIRHEGGATQVFTTYPYPDQDETPPKRLNIDGLMYRKVE